MPIYDPDSVGRGTPDAELAGWLPTGTALGADVPIAQGRRDHTQLGVGPWPPILAVDTLVPPGPHGSPAVRCHRPHNPEQYTHGALVYIPGGGFTYGTLDEFGVPTRLITQRARIVTSVVEYQLAPAARYPTLIEEIDYVVHWRFDQVADQGVGPAKIATGGGIPSVASVVDVDRFHFSYCG
jgi:acetyl esterase